MLDIQSLFPDADAALTQVLEASPRSLLAVNAELDYNRPLSDNDPRYVDTAKARADKFRKHFFATFGYDPASGQFEPQPSGKRKHVLFFGHVGCGKSTELARLCSELDASSRFWVVRVNVVDLIDPGNADYSDIWLAVAQQLMHRLQHDQLAIEPIALQRMNNWFSERVLTDEKINEFSAEVKTEAEMGGGIPFMAKLLAKFTAVIKSGGSRRDVVRTVVKNTFDEFIKALDLLITSATVAVTSSGKGRQILFMIDGADRFRSDDWKRLFVDDANQLTMARCVVVYTVPMALKSSGHRLDLFDSLVLPMIKLHDSDDAAGRRPEAYDAMRKMLLKRCHYSLIDATGTLDALIDCSGGHLRDAFRLLSYACVEAEDSVLTQVEVDAAAKRLAGDYRDWLEPEHYAVLVDIAGQPENAGRNDMITRLVDGGALLEYNTGRWRQPHPVVRLLPGYKKAEAAAQNPSA